MIGGLENRSVMGAVLFILMTAILASGSPTSGIRAPS